VPSLTSTLLINEADSFIAIDESFLMASWLLINPALSDTRL
jgi:hypothetical protein